MIETNERLRAQRVGPGLWLRPRDVAELLRRLRQQPDRAPRMTVLGRRVPLRTMAMA